MKRGHEVTVLASRQPKEKHLEETIDGIKVVRIPLIMRIGAIPISHPRLFTEILKRDFDICNLHEPNPPQNFMAYFALKLKRKPYVITYHSDVEPYRRLIRIFKLFYEIFKRKFLLKNAKAIMPTSPQYINLSDSLPPFREKCTVIPNGVDLNLFYPVKVKKDKSKKTIFYMGRLIYYKGLEYLIRAMPLVLKKVPNAKLIIAGEGKLEKKLKELAREVGVSKYIEWKTYRLDTKEQRVEYSKCDVFVLPSIYKTEAFGIVLLEAMACGAPCVGTTISGTTYVLEDAGMAVKPKDEKALADAIIKVLTNEKLEKEMKKKSMTKAKKFEWENISKMFEKAYKVALSQ